LNLALLGLECRNRNRKGFGQDSFKRSFDVERIDLAEEAAVAIA
jgi:hypothetical protein